MVHMCIKSSLKLFLVDFDSADLVVDSLLVLFCSDVVMMET